MNSRGISLIDILVTLACMVLLSALLVSCGLARAREAARITQDAAQQRGVWHGLSAWSASNDGRFPEPGMINRLPHPAHGEIRGIGPRDWSRNTTANLWSAMIMEHLVTPDSLLSPLEFHPRAAVDADYDYDAYSPMDDVYWDPNFSCDPSDMTRPMSASYAHVALCGDRVNTTWTMSATRQPVLALRGPDGLPGSPEYDNSPTLRFMDPSNMWSGNIVYTDGSVQTHQPAAFSFDDGQNDSIFLTEDPVGDDVWLGVFTACSEKNATASFDPLD